jgi:tetratricopeptide (TPR) repeat protein
MGTETEEPNDLPSTEKQTRFFLLVLVLVSILQYSYSFGNGFVWDAKGVFVDDPTIRELKYLPGYFTEVSSIGDSARRTAQGGTPVRSLAYYRPLMKVIHLAEYAAFGTNPIPYNVVNILLNALVVALCFLLVSSITGNSWVAFGASFLYAVNPARAEVVSWSYSDSYIVMAVLSLSSLYLYHKRRYFPALLLFAFALLSHETAVVLPMMVLFYELLVRRERSFATAGWLFGFFLLTGLFLIVRRSVAGPAPVTDLAFIPLFNAVVVAVKRLVKSFFLPDAPVTIYQYRPGMFASMNGEIALSYAVAVFLAVCGLFLRLKKRPLFFWYLWFFLFISIAFNVGRFGDYFIFEKLLYVASLGFCVVIAGLLESIGRKGLGLGLIAVLAVPQFGVTFHRTLFWTDTATYLEKALEFAPDYSLGHYSLGIEYASRKQYDKAIGEYGKTLALRPDLQFVSGHISDLYNKKGYEYAFAGRYEEAMKEFENSLSIRPDQSGVYNNLGNIYSLRGLGGEALNAWRKAVALDPLNYEASFNLALAYEKKGDLGNALKYYRACLGLYSQASPSLLEKVRALERRKPGQRGR